jgi:hypothetical protein
MRKSLRWLCLFLALGWVVFTIPALAQTTANAVLSPPVTQNFPQITAHLEARTGDGKFVHGLKAEDVRIQEDGRELPVRELREIRQGVQVVFAINPGPPFGVRNSQGVTRYDMVAGALAGWAKSRLGSNLDDLTLIATGAASVNHLSSPADWLAALESLSIDNRLATPTLDTLSQAIDLAADPTPQPAMKRVIWLVTAPVEGDLSAGLQSLTARARELGVQIFIWQIASAETDETAALAWQDLANQTGGRFYNFTGSEPLVDLEPILEPMRSVYHLTYNSQIAAGGSHRLSATLRMDGGETQTPAQEFEFTLAAPDPAFLSPEVEIWRRLPEEAATKLWEQADLSRLSPREQQIQILVDFPDGHPRPLASTSLYVDGELAQKNVAPPFDRFVWDLSGYTVSGQHILKLEAVDSLGMTGTSIETPVQVQVAEVVNSPLAVLARNAPVIAGGIALLAAGVVLLALVLGGRISPHPGFIRRGFHRGSRQKKGTEQLPEIPGGKPLPPDLIGSRLPAWMNRLHWPQRRLAPLAAAYLIQVADASPAEAIAPPIAVASHELTFGRDPQQATLVMDDPSIDPLHARLVQDADGSFRLIDEGSVAGTWVNFSPAPREGARLEQGDLIHIGRISFRFKQREPQHTFQTVTIVEEAEL